MKKLIFVLLLSFALQIAPAQLSSQQVAAGAVSGTLWGIALPNYTQMVARMYWKLALSYLLQDEVMEEIEEGERDRRDSRCDESYHPYEVMDSVPILLPYVEKSFKYPADFIPFVPRPAGYIDVKGKNINTLTTLEGLKPGKWLKTYYNGSLSDGTAVSMHFFRHNASGFVAFVKCVQLDGR